MFILGLRNSSPLGKVARFSHAALLPGLMVLAIVLSATLAQAQLVLLSDHRLVTQDSFIQTPDTDFQDWSTFYNFEEAGNNQISSVKATGFNASGLAYASMEYNHSDSSVFDISFEVT